MMITIILQRLQDLYSEAQGAVTWMNVLIYGSIFTATWMVYRLAIYPYMSVLRKIPGRQRNNIFIGNMGEILKGEPVDPFVKWITEMKSGFIRYHHLLGYQRIVVAEPEAMKHILITHAKNYVKPAFLFRILMRFTGRGLLCLNGQEHISQRKLCMSSFKMAVLKNMVPTMQRHTENLIGLWKRQIEENNKMQLLVNGDLQRMTMDILSECAFGYDTNSLLDPDQPLTKAVHYMIGGMKPKLLRILMPKIYDALPISENRKFKEYQKMSDELIKNLIENKKSVINEDTDESKCTDLLSVLLLARDVETGTGFSQQQLRDHVLTFMLAGHETTSTAICWSLLCLAQRPEVMARVRQEVTTVLPPKGETLTFEHLEKMTYLSCFVKEIQRLYPSVPMTFRQAVNDDVINGHFIPAGTVMNLQMGAMARSPLIWKDPEEFRPERFMNEEEVKPYTFLPFLAGSRICIGQKFATMEMKVILALLIHEFTFHPLPDVTYKKQLRLTMKPEPSLKLTADII
ncbi:cytochrome P450 4B1-like [Gigantopelta aegis]|uniref:cytochrome P450 4B1-like n=1 Tax=Gigantopelta aegis TaxID=1735272 RepID=UPI001B88BA23|nr:cytochrome P450 4B1-like [Gigantopelta aegis]